MKNAYLFFVQLMAWIDESGNPHTKKTVSRHKVIKQTHSQIYIHGNIGKVAKSVLGDFRPVRYGNGVDALRCGVWVDDESETGAAYETLRLMMMDALNNTLVNTKKVLASVRGGPETIEEKAYDEGFVL